MKNTLSKIFNPFNLSIVVKISLAGFLMALLVVLNKILAVNYISFIPFVRISFGSLAVSVLASYLLGPLYGLVVCAGADVIGYFIFDMSSFPFYPQITLTYALLGSIPSLLFAFIGRIKNDGLMKFIEYTVFGLAFLHVLRYFLYNDTLTLYRVTYDLLWWHKLVIMLLIIHLFAVVVITNEIFAKKMKKIEGMPSIYQISFVVFLSEVFISFLFGGLMKACAFGMNMIIPIYLSQMILMFLNIPLNTYMLYLLLMISKRSFIK